MKTFEVVYTDQPWRNTKFKVRGICERDVLNPCWDNRPTDVPGYHWGAVHNGKVVDDFKACPACTKAATAAAGK
jgi:hypothetical protein